MKLTFLPEHQSVESDPAQTILDAARRVGVDIVATCGGRGRCNSCRIETLDGEFTPPTDQERTILGEHGLARGFRLGCQTKALSDATVRIVPPISERQFRILSATERHRYAIEPAVRKQHVHLPALTEERQTSDYEELQRLIASEQIDLGALQQLPATIFEASREVTAILADDRLIGVEAGDTTDRLYGLAFDIGTTTVVGYLLDLKTGQEMAVASELNAQALYGGDLMSRISFAQEHEAGLQRLHDRIIHCCNRIIADVCDQAGIEPQQIYEVTVVGNSCMHHLLLGISPVHLGQAPYLAAIRQRYSVRASDLNLAVFPSARVQMVPLIAGFVGADTVGVVLATGLHAEPGLKLAVDIGTNGEIVLGSRDRMVACSTAAGTAFEGAQITHGMRGAAGAIDKVTIDDDVHIRVIGDGPAMGICGSGLVDAVAQMLDAGMLTATGRFRKIAELEQRGTPEALRERVIEHGKQRAFVLADGTQTDTGEPILITQHDVRELQLAKGAIFAGIRMLLNAFEADEAAITELLLAGAFGNYIDTASAVRIGLIPPLPPTTIRSVGNAAGLGSQLALLSQTASQEADTIAARAEHLALTNNPEFQLVFAESLGFPE